MPATVHASQPPLLTPIPRAACCRANSTFRGASRPCRWPAFWTKYLWRNTSGSWPNTWTFCRTSRTSNNGGQPSTSSSTYKTKLLIIIILYCCYSTIWYMTIACSVYRIYYYTMCLCINIVYKVFWKLCVARSVCGPLLCIPVACTVCVGKT